MPSNDLTNNRFGRWTVIKKTGKTTNCTFIWLCKCDCGTEKEVPTNRLTLGTSTSCGCYQKELTSKLKTIHGHDIRGQVSTEYKAWFSMIARCCNPKTQHYQEYGGRGIKVCDRWRNSFQFFLDDMGFKPSPKHSLDRHPNNNGDYTPSNCRWATSKEQCLNRRSNVFHTHDGITLTQGEWEIKWNISQSTIRKHLNKNRSFEWIYNYYTSKNNIISQSVV